jgi:hypothetical protein
MPRVPQNYADQAVNPPNPVTGEQYVAPENVLVAAAHMNEMGRLFATGGGGRFAGLRGHKARPSQSLKVKR